MNSERAVQALEAFRLEMATRRTPNQILDSLGRACDLTVCSAVAVLVLDLEGRAGIEFQRGAQTHLDRARHVEIVALGDRERPWGAVVASWTSSDPGAGALLQVHALVQMAVLGVERLEGLDALGAARAGSLETIARMSRLVIHELRNGLSGIGGAMQLVRSDLAEGDPNRELLDLALERFVALAELLLPIVDFARPLDFLPAKVDLRAALRESAGAMACNQHRGETVVVVADGDEALVEADGVLLRLALDPLIENAFRASSGSGVVRAGVTRVQAGWQVWIEDDGAGIPMDIRARATDPFVTTYIQAWGLGLAWVVRVAEVHLARLAIDCPPHGGTRVSLLFPAG